MTPQGAPDPALEALAQAIGTVLDYPTINGTTPSWDDTAAAILDALPEGWALLRRNAAQQEHERLRAEWRRAVTAINTVAAIGGASTPTAADVIRLVDSMLWGDEQDTASVLGYVVDQPRLMAEATDE